VLPQPKTTPRPPKYLRASTRRWFASVVSMWALEEHHIRLLTLACEAWDRAQQAREVIARDGLTTPTRDNGTKLHPACRVEDASRIAFARLIRELDLDIEVPKAESRPPRLRSIVGG
jgi:P27 family predicted phage terminase small subunit